MIVASVCDLAHSRFISLLDIWVWGSLLECLVAKFTEDVYLPQAFDVIALFPCAVICLVVFFLLLHNNRRYRHIVIVYSALLLKPNLVRGLAEEIGVIAVQIS